MAASSLLLSALLTLGTSIGFAVIARAALRTPRAATGPARRAGVAFGAFWIGASLVALSQGSRTLLAFLQLDSYPLIRSIEELSTPFYCLSAAGILYYVAYLLTGRERLLLPIAAYYLTMWTALRYHVALARPIGHEVTGWNVNYVYEAALVRPSYTATVLLTVAPLLLSLLAYATLALRVHAPAMRYRVACVSVGLWAWVGVEALVFATGLANSLEGELGRRIVGLVSTGIILLGYAPPMAAQKRWGARNVFSEPRDVPEA